MRLISCHIENFGKLHDFDMSFSEGLNVICRENGWGKSTLAAFLKAMLYGLDGERRRDLDGNERKKFSPWQGGIFGGRLDFEAGGKQYSVTRTFGDTASKDIFELRDLRTNLLSDDFSERLGEELFRLDSASFFRSIFIGQSDCPTSSTDDIHAKIGNLADNTDDMNNYESADEKLKKQINTLSPKLKNGLLYKMSVEIADLRRRVAEGSNLGEDITACDNRLAQTEKQRSELLEKRSSLETEQKKAIKLHALSRQRAEWERLKKVCEASGKALEEARAVFPGEIPSESDVQAQLRTAVEMKSAESLMRSYELSVLEGQKLTALGCMFNDAAPSGEEIDAMLKEAKELRRMSEKYERLRLTQDEQDRLEQLTLRFAVDGVSPSDLAARWNERISRKNAIGSKRAAFSAIESTSRRSKVLTKKRFLLSTAAGIVLILLSAALFVTFSDLLFLFGALIGGLFIAAGIIAVVISDSTGGGRISDQLRMLRDEIQNDEDFIESVENETEEYLIAHCMEYHERTVLQKLEELSDSRRELESLRRKAGVAEDYLREHDLTSLTGSITDFLRKNGVISDGSELSDQLYKLKENASEYEVLCRKSKLFTEAQKKYLAVKEGISTFLTSYGYVPDEKVRGILEEIRGAVDTHARLTEAEQKAAAELASFEKSHDMTALGSVTSNDLPSLEKISSEISECSGQLEELNQSFHSLRQNREELSAKFSRWESDSCKLRELSDRRADGRLKYDRLVKARELLRVAKERLTAKYVAPVRESFAGYYGILAEDSAEKYRIDPDINITAEELGRQRDIRALSAGFRDLIGICLRLALADAMYLREKPALIMDDPFTNLDDGKIAASGKLLRKAAQNYQIIYFTCSAARSAGNLGDAAIRRQEN